MDPSCFKVVKKLAIEDPEEKQSEIAQLALCNNLVLREIFKFLPASTLKSCSLVNRLWRTECYTYCRDYRKWMAKINAANPCVSLVRFNQLVGSMTLVPFNGLSLHVDLSKTHNFCECKSPGELFTDVLDKLTWRHMDILIDFRVDMIGSRQIGCAAVRFGITLLEQKTAGLESLKFQVYDDLRPHISPDWPPALPYLRSICFPHRCQRRPSFQHTAPCFLMRLTNAAPNLKEIRGMIDYRTLQLFPEEKWGYVKDFLYTAPVRNGSDEFRIASKFVSIRPSLRKFCLELPHSSRRTNEVPIFNVLIELSQMTMEECEIQSTPDESEMLENSLKLPQMPKLRQLRLDIKLGFRQVMEKAQFLLNKHDGQGFPQLKEVRLSSFTVIHDYGDFLPRPEIRDESDSHAIESLELPVQSFPSVSKLQLDLYSASSSFVQIKSLFPSVTEIHITCAPAVGNDMHSRLPHKQIFRLWQNLEVISICYDYVDPAYNLDAAFCGLDEKEVELLGQEDDDFLMTVQVVPIAPCVLTMPNLRSFSYNCPSGVEAAERGPYITRVGCMLVKRYLPKALVIVLGKPTGFSGQHY